MRELAPDEPVRVGDRVMLRIGVHVTIMEIRPDGSLCVEHQPGEEHLVPRASVWQLVSRRADEQDERTDT